MVFDEPDAMDLRWNVSCRSLSRHSWAHLKTTTVLHSFLSFLLPQTVYDSNVGAPLLLARDAIADMDTDYIARAISDYLTSETGVTIIFESAIVPKWKDSRISFKNVYVSLLPKDKTSSRVPCQQCGLPFKLTPYLFSANY